MNAFPHKIEDVDEETAKEVAKNFKDKCVFVGRDKFVLPIRYCEFAEKYYNFQVRPSDVFVTGYPRSGTTMTEELAWLLVNNLDIEKSKKLAGTANKVSYFEVDIMVMPQPWPKELSDRYTPFDKFDQLPDRRVFKTHLSLSLLPPNFLTCGSKVIYVVRNPKDIMVSFYHFQQRKPLNDKFKASFETFANFIMDSKMRYTPFWKLLEQYWQNRNSPNLLFIFYEDVIKDTKGSIQKLARFLIGRDLTTEEVDKLTDHIKFDNFKKSMTSQDYLLKKGDENDGFARKGQVGQSQDYFQGDLKVKADKWIKENVERIGIKYPYLD